MLPILAMLERFSAAAPWLSGGRLQFESIRWMQPTTQQLTLIGLGLVCLALAIARYKFVEQPLSIWVRGSLAALHTLALGMITLIVLSPVIKFDLPEKNTPSVTILSDRQSDEAISETLAKQLEQRGLEVHRVANVSEEIAGEFVSKLISSGYSEPLVFVGTTGLEAARRATERQASSSTDSPLFFVEGTRNQTTAGQPQLRIQAPQLVQAESIQYGTLEIRRAGLPKESRPTEGTPIRVQARYLNDSDSGNKPEAETIWRTQIPGDEGTIAFPIDLNQEGLVELVATLEEPAPASGTQSADPPAPASARCSLVVTGSQSQILYITGAPTWQCRFLQEALRRDPAFGIDGIHIFSSSVDRQLAKENALYLPELPKSVVELLPYDVVILDDPNSDEITPEFAALLHSYVADFGGGVVLAAGSANHGRAFAESLPELLPIEAQPLEGSTGNEGTLREPGLRFPKTSARWSSITGFASEKEQPLTSLSSANWFQPAARIKPRTTVIAEHPTFNCSAQPAAQPLIAARELGEGMVVWLATNETWRLRGEELGQAFDRFWKVLLGQTRPAYGIGKDKYFSLQCDRNHSQPGDTVTLTARMRNRDFADLPPADSPQTAAVEVLLPDGSVQSSIVELEPASGDLWQARWVSSQPGIYSFRLIHPETGAARSTSFICQRDTPRKADEDTAIQQALAGRSGGRIFSSELSSDEIAGQIAEAVGRQTTESKLRRIEKPLNQLPLWFGLVATLLCTEWIARRFLGLL